MVKAFLVLWLTALSLWAQTPLFEKIESLIGQDTYERNRSFIKIIFSPVSDYEHNNGIDVVRVVDRLKENGLMNLFFERPRSLELTFLTNGKPLFFAKLMDDTLHDLGYYRYITKEAKLENNGFVWSVSLTSEYATDPTLLRKELLKRGCDIVDIERLADDRWKYKIDMSQAHLKLQPLKDGDDITFKRLNFVKWLDVSEVKKLTLWSLKGNNWYPYITFYDKTLRLLKVYKRDRKTWQLVTSIPREAVYVKIADLYSQKNIKDGLRIETQGVK